MKHTIPCVNGVTKFSIYTIWLCLSLESPWFYCSQRMSSFELRPKTHLTLKMSCDCQQVGCYNKCTHFYEAIRSGPTQFKAINCWRQDPWRFLWNAPSLIPSTSLKKVFFCPWKLPLDFFLHNLIKGVSQIIFFAGRQQFCVVAENWLHCLEKVSQRSWICFSALNWISCRFHGGKFLCSGKTSLRQFGFHIELFLLMTSSSCFCLSTFSCWTLKATIFIFLKKVWKNWKLANLENWSGWVGGGGESAVLQ